MMKARRRVVKPEWLKLAVGTVRVEPYGEHFWRSLALYCQVWREQQPAKYSVLENIGTAPRIGQSFHVTAAFPVGPIPPSPPSHL